MGRLSDKIGHRNILIGGTVAAAMLYLPQFMVNNVWQLGILQVLTGVAIGAIMPTISALLAGFTPVGTEGKVYGLQSSLTSGSRTLAPILGSIAVALLGLRGVFLLAGIMFIFIAAIAIRHLPEVPHEKGSSPKLTANPQAA
jgi:DHA1 family multidrug resistance protein-like MFS transporter